MQLLNINKKIADGWAFQLEFITWSGTKNDFPIYENSFSIQFKNSMGINWSLSLIGFRVLDIWIYKQEETTPIVTEG